MMGTQVQFRFIIYPIETGNETQDQIVEISLYSTTGSIIIPKKLDFITLHEYLIENYTYKEPYAEVSVDASNLKHLTIWQRRKLKGQYTKENIDKHINFYLSERDYIFNSSDIKNIIESINVYTEKHNTIFVPKEKRVDGYLELNFKTIKYIERYYYSYLVYLLKGQRSLLFRLHTLRYTLQKICRGAEFIIATHVAYYEEDTNKQCRAKKSLADFSSEWRVLNVYIDNILRCNLDAKTDDKIIMMSNSVFELYKSILELLRVKLDDATEPELQNFYRDIMKYADTRRQWGT
jgi:hypothetical protein